MTVRQGSKLIHPHHGAAKIVDSITRVIKGVPTDCWVIKILNDDTNLTIQLPKSKLTELGIRKAIPKKELPDLYAVMQKKNVSVPPKWNRRMKNHDEMLKEGDIYMVAEVVRNIWREKQRRGELPPSEQQMYERALNILGSELSLSLGVSLEEAFEVAENVLAGNSK